MQGMTHKSCLVLGPQDSSASLPFSQAAVCADWPVTANSDRTLVTAVLETVGRREERGTACRLWGWDAKGSFYWSMGIIEGGCLEALHIMLGVG